MRKMQEDIIKLAKEIAYQIEKEKDLPEKYKIETFKLLLQHGLGLGVGIAGKGVPSAIGVTGEEISFSEFLNQIEEPRTNPQRFAAVAYFYETTRDEISVTQENIITTLTEAGLPPPKNFSRDMRTANSTRNALLMSADPKDGNPSWRLTRTGRNFIEQRAKHT